MRRYSSSKLRVLLFCVLIGVCTFIATSYGQAAPGSDAAAPVHHAGVFSIIMSNKDFVFWLILIRSIFGVTLIIRGAIQNRRSVLMPDATINHMRELIQARQFKELIDFTENDPSFVARALNPALKRAPSFNSMKEAMETALGEQTAEQFRQIEYLNIIGNLGPLLGLLGTVLGMIEAFSRMQEAAGSANPGDLAGGISKALCHTMLGLLLAVPCLASFGILRTIVDRLTVQGALIAEELLLMIKPAEAKPAAAGALRPGAMPQPAVAPRKAPAPPPAPLPAPQG